MKRFYIVLSVFIGLVSSNLNAQCTAQEVIEEDFESYTAGQGKPMPACWTRINTGAGGVRNKAGDAHNGSKYIFMYTLFVPNTVNYFVTPELSTIDGLHFAEFYIKSNRSNVTYEYGTMSDNSDPATFVSLGTGSFSQDSYTKVTTPNITATANHKYFAIKATAPTWHTGIYLDDFSWKASNLSVTDEVLGDEFKFYPNPTKDKVFINAKEKINSVIIYNSIGQMVLQKRYNNKNINVNIQHLPAGNYMIQTIMDSETKSFKIIKD